MNKLKIFYFKQQGKTLVNEGKNIIKIVKLRRDNLFAFGVADTGIRVGKLIEDDGLVFMKMQNSIFFLPSQTINDIIEYKPDFLLATNYYECKYHIIDF